MKRILITGFLLLTVLVPGKNVLNAAPVNRNQAQDIAKRFIQTDSKQNVTGDAVCVYPAALAAGTPTKGSEFAPLYAFNLFDDDNNPAGFVIVAGESDFSPIIGYAYGAQAASPASFPTNIPENLKEYLNWFETKIETYQQQAFGIPVSKTVTPKIPKADADPIVAPLLENHPDGSILFNQRWPYNDMCPNPDDQYSPTVTGCVATALAQIARYYEYPEQGQGSVTYVWEGATYSADFSQSRYDWENMLTAYNRPDTVEYTRQQIDAVALLHKDIGYAVKMMYGYNGSGAYDYNAMIGMVNHLGYSRAVRYEPSANYDAEGWRELLSSQLDLGQPLYHSGYGGGGGHAFVCDGYNEDNYFHFNWGWAGFGNGWYLLDDLAPVDLGTGAGNGVYNDGRTVLVNMRPPREGDESVAELSYSIGSYPKALDCKRGIYNLSDTLNCNAYDFYNYTADTFWVELGIAYWKDGVFVAVEEYDYEQAWNSGWDPGNGEHGEYEGPGETLPPMYGYNQVYFKAAPGRILEEGTYRMALAARYNRTGDWKEVKAPVSLLSAYKLVVRGDSVLVFLPDEQGDIPAPEFPDVINLRYKVIGTSAIVVWDVDSSLHNLPERFRIFIDDQYKGVTRITQYMEDYLSAGEHEAKIVALYPNNGESDGVTVRFRVTESANEKTEAFGNGLCRIWPNPFGDEIKVETACAGVLKMMTQDGKTLKSIRLKAGTRSVETDGISAGLYILRFEAANGRTATGKAVRR